MARTRYPTARQARAAAKRLGWTTLRPGAYYRSEPNCGCPLAALAFDRLGVVKALDQCFCDFLPRGTGLSLDEVQCMIAGIDGDDTLPSSSYTVPKAYEAGRRMRAALWPEL